MQFKTFTLFIAFFFSASMVFSQAKIVNSNPQKTLRNTFQIKQHNQQRFMATDTIGPPVFADACSQSVVSFTVNNLWGFVGGMNELGDLEKAQRFIYESDSYEVLETLIFFDAAKVVGDGDVTVKIYDVGADNGPNNLLATSNPIKVSDLAIDEQEVVPTFFSFSNPAKLSESEFFVSVDFSELYTSQDTVSLFMTDEDCGKGIDSWELFSDGTTWLPIIDSSSWNFDASFFMIATVQTEGATSTKELSFTDGKIRLHDAFPNPTSQELTVRYDLESSAELRIEIYSIDGKLLQQLDKPTQPAGQYQEVISTQNLASGIYLYGIVTDKGRLMNKFSVEK